MADPNLQKDAPAPDPNGQGQDQSQNQPHVQNNGGPTPGPAPIGVGPAKTASASASPSMPPAKGRYTSQFTAGTEYILARMKGSQSSLSSALLAASKNETVTSGIKPAAYEDAKRRLVSGMTTSSSMTMPMPVASSPPARSPSIPAMAPVPATAPARALLPKSPYLAVPATTPGPARTKAAGMSAIMRISSGLTMGGKPIGAKPPKPSAAKPAAAETKVVKKARVPRAVGTATATGRRKNAKKEDDTSSLSSLSDLSEDDASTDKASVATQPQPHTMTKSGRQVQKPVTYNPADMESSGSRKRPHYGKRTAEQALCKKCSRMHSPASNQMVFCDGCNEGWHQRCHEPWILDEMVHNQNSNWFCSQCQAKREPRPPVAKKQRIEPPKQPARESWAAKSAQVKRAYLLTLPQPDLVSLIMQSLEIHPDLPIFPHIDGNNNATSPSTSSQPRSLFAQPTTEGLFSRADAHPAGQLNSIRKATGTAVNGTKNGKNGSRKEGSHDTKAESTPAEDPEEEFDPLVALWPKPGQGLYSRLPPDTQDDEHLVDDGDYEAFSTIVYEKGKKVMENGMKV